MIIFENDTVAAGSFSAPVHEKKSSMISLDEFLIPHPKRTFMVRVRGDSMVGAGICSGDYVLVERGVMPSHGKIVVAKMGTGMVIKYWIVEGKKPLLRSASEGYGDILVGEDVECVGVVVAVVRKY